MSFVGRFARWTALFGPFLLCLPSCAGGACRFDQREGIRDTRVSAWASKIKGHTTSRRERRAATGEPPSAALVRPPETDATGAAAPATSGALALSFVPDTLAVSVNPLAGMPEGARDDVMKSFSGADHLRHQDLLPVATKFAADPASVVGAVALLDDGGDDPELWAAVVVTPEIAASFREEIAGEGIPDQSAIPAVARLVASLGIDVVSRSGGDPQTFVLRSRAATPHEWLAAAAAVGKLPENAGLAECVLIRRHAAHGAGDPVVVRRDRGRPATKSPGRRDELPDDPLCEEQWHLRNTGRFDGREAGIPGADVRVPEAWSVAEKMGRGVKVAVLDPGGIDWRHEDLRENMLAATPAHTALYEEIAKPGTRVKDISLGWDFRFRASGAEASGHGTAVAGVVAAAAGNGVGGCGVAPKATILPLRTGGTDVDDANAIDFARRMGADVIVCSWDYGRRTPIPGVVREAVIRAITKGRQGKGCVFVCSLTNERLDNFEPGVARLCTIPGVIAVGRSTDADLWGRSGFGAGMSVIAPSSPCWSTATGLCDLANLEIGGTRHIVTTDQTGAAGLNSGDDGTRRQGCDDPANGWTETTDGSYTRLFGGTSAAAPIVAGIAALLLAENSSLTSAEVKRIIETTADRIDPLDDAGTTPVSPAEYQRTRGAGRANALRAVRNSAPSVSLSSSGPSAAEVGAPFDWKIVLSNDGELPLRDVRVTVKLPQGTVMDWADTGGTSAAGRAVWDISQVPGGRTVALAARFRSSRRGEFDGDALAEGTGVGGRISVTSAGLTTIR